MDEDVRDEPRASNDSRSTTPVESGKEATVESKPSMGQRWSQAQPTKMATFWLCLASVAVVLIVGFTWGGWMTEGGAEKQAQAMAKDAVIERLAPICVAQFNLDPDNALKLSEFNELTSSQQPRFVREQGWATLSGETEPDRQVANACAKLLMGITE